VGCSECSGTGYRGRLAITEVLIGSPELERRIAANESADRIADAAREGGMRSLWEAGIAHVKAGATTLEELMRVIEVPSEAAMRARTAEQRAVEEPQPKRSSGGYGAVRRDGNGSAVATPTSPHRPHGMSEEAFQLLDDFVAPARRGGRTILLVEDEEPLRRMLRELLEREGYTVAEAGDGVTALDEIDRIAPDVVVLDLNLPRLDGYGVLSHLRARPQTAGIPVIVLTAQGDEDSEERVFEYGANDFLTKPFRPRALSARLRSLLKRG
jgi:CheY-like chemotaxis protein